MYDNNDEERFKAPMLSARVPETSAYIIIDPISHNDTTHNTRLLHHEEREQGKEKEVFKNIITKTTLTTFPPPNPLIPSCLLKKKTLNFNKSNEEEILPDVVASLNKSPVLISFISYLCEIEQQYPGSYDYSINSNFFKSKGILMSEANNIIMNRVNIHLYLDDLMSCNFSSKINDNGSNFIKDYYNSVFQLHEDLSAQGLLKSATNTTHFF